MLSRALFITSICVAAWAASLHTVSAQSNTAGCEVAGRYKVVGRNPGDTRSFEGSAVISTNNVGGCYMKWSAPNASEGHGSYANGVLTIEFGPIGGGIAGVVKYTRAPNGEMHGVWYSYASPSNQGTESLYPN